MTDMDIISAIDQATGCQQCGAPLNLSVSDDFCGEGCQQAWHARRVDVMALTDPAPPREGDRIVVRHLNRPAQAYISRGGQWEYVGPADRMAELVDGPMPVPAPFATPVDYRAAVGDLVDQLARMHSIPRELLGFHDPDDRPDPPGSVHIRGNGTSYTP